MVSLFFTMLFVFIAYISFIWIKYGIQPSISESYYRLPEKYGILFTLFCWGFSIPVMILGNTPLMFVAGAGICFVGTTYAFKRKLEGIVHTISALIGIVASQVSILIDFEIYYVLPITVVLGFITALIVKHKIWWLEIIAFLSICYVLGLQVFK